MNNRLTFDEYHRLGETVSRRLETHCSFSTIGKVIGLSKQGARQVAMVALGKVAHRLQVQYKD